ncbi:hypothetical protein HNR19_000303 [Nocardioides thalensis]|uniref:Uncharacterized protein n=1 Tax=Nocardioides thalensis TaxID=1914755 RepID=A0A853BWX1_9ACTN|nr:hypothetical protein [Nocardioides thalensis]NYI99604.1 hypothetical protein [Nocardioides thalensis]
MPRYATTVTRTPTAAQGPLASGGVGPPNSAAAAAGAHAPAHAGPVTSTIQGVAEEPHASGLYIWWAYGLVALAVVAGVIIGETVNPDPPVAVAGVSAFAGLYIAAQAIERVLVPFRPWLGDPLGKIDTPTPAADDENAPQAEGSAKPSPKARLRLARDRAFGAATTLADKAAADPEQEPAAKEAASLAAQTQAAVAQERVNASVVMWGVASAIGIVVSAFLGLALLQSTGIRGAPYALDVVVTGLAIGGGTKPLHDLISRVEAAKEARSDPDEAK